MAARRSGSPVSFWDAIAASGATLTSTPVEVARGSDQIAIYVTTSGATVITIECAHSGAVNADGTTNDANDSDWGPLLYLNTVVNYTFAGAGSVVLIIPDFEPAWIRLKSSQSVTLTAGHEVTSG